MIDNRARKMLAFCSGGLTFVAMLLLLGSYSYGSGREKMWVALFQVRVAYIPLLFYILGLSIASGLFIFVIVAYFQKKTSRPVIEKIHTLAKGNFEDPVFDRKVVSLHENKELYLLQQDLFSVREKMVEMSSELQVLNQEPQYFGGQTKEEILETERHRLARELHDSVSQELFAAMMMMSALTEIAKKQDMPEAAQKQLQTISGIISTAQSEMRALLLHLRPVSLEDKSLKKGIEQLLGELQTKIEISMTWDIEEVKISKNIEDQLFRVVQELLSNTLRHAKADELEVYLHLIDQNILLRVIDDGVGFDPKNQEKAGSYGLLNIRERITGLGGTVKVISFKGQGTSVEIKVPLIREDVVK